MFASTQKKIQRNEVTSNSGVPGRQPTDVSGGQNFEVQTKTGAPKKKELTYFDPPELLAVLGLNPEEIIQRTDPKLWKQVQDAAPSKDGKGGIATYRASNNDNQLKLSAPKDSPLPQLLMRVLLDAGKTSAACALVAMCNRKTRIEPLFLLLQEMKDSGKNFEQFLPEVKKTLRASLPGTGKYLFNQEMLAEFSRLVALCPQQIKALVLVRTRPSPIIGPISEEVRAALMRPVRAAMQFAVQEAMQDPNPSVALQELGMLVDALYAERIKRPWAREMAIELNGLILSAVSQLKLSSFSANFGFSLGNSFVESEREFDAEHQEASLQLKAIDITAEVGGSWTWPATLPLKEGWESVLFAYLKTAFTLGPAYAYLAARLIELGDNRYDGFVSRALAAHASSPEESQYEDMIKIVECLQRSEDPCAKGTAVRLVNELLKFPQAYLKAWTNIEFDPVKGWVVPDSLPQNWERFLFNYIQALPKPYDHGPLWAALFAKPEREIAVAHALLDRGRGYPQALVKAVLETERGWLEFLRPLEHSASSAKVIAGASNSTFFQLREIANRLASNFNALVCADARHRPSTVDIALEVVRPSAKLLIERFEKQDTTARARELIQGYDLQYFYAYLKLAGLCGQPYLSYAGEKFKARAVTRDEVLAMVGIGPLFNVAEMLLPHTAWLFELFKKKKLDEFAMAALKKALPGQESATKKLVAKIMVKQPLSSETLATFLSAGHGQASIEGKEERRKAILAFHKALAKGRYVAARAWANSDSLSEEPEFREAALAKVDRKESRK